MKVYCWIIFSVSVGTENSENDVDEYHRQHKEIDYEEEEEEELTAHVVYASWWNFKNR